LEGDKGWIRLDKGKNLDSQWHFRCPCGLSMVEVGLGLLFPFLGSQALLLQHGQSLGARFLIVCVEDGYEVLVKDSLCG
jgi:hypothetical protein